MGDTSNSNDQSQGRSSGQVPPIMLLLQQLLGLQHDQQTGAGSNQDAPSAPPSSPRHPHQQTSPPSPHPLLDISKHLLLLLNRISSAQTVLDPEEDKMIVDNILRT